MANENPSRMRLPGSPKNRVGGGGRQGPLGPGGRFGYLKADKQKEARERQDFRDTLTPQQQLDRLDKRLGKGHGAKKERARLAKLISAKSDK